MSVRDLLIAGLLALQPAPPGASCSPCAVSAAGEQLVITFEGYSPVVYKDSAGKDTVGYGHLVRAGEAFEVVLPNAARALLLKDLSMAEKGVNRNTSVMLKQYQYDPLVSFTFNLGEGAYKGSTLRKKVNAGRHYEVREQFMRWVYAGGVPVKGLEIRRAAEAAMYEGR